MPPPPSEPYLTPRGLPSQSSTELVPAELSSETMHSVALDRITLHTADRQKSRESIEETSTSSVLNLQGTRQLRETCLSFVSSLPRSCLSFLALAVLASLANCVHGATLIAVGASCLSDEHHTAEQQRQMNANFVFYGTSQARPPPHALRRPPPHALHLLHALRLLCSLYSLRLLRHTRSCSSGCSSVSSPSTACCMRTGSRCTPPIPNPTFTPAPAPPPSPSPYPHPTLGPNPRPNSHPNPNPNPNPHPSPHPNPNRHPTPAPAPTPALTPAPAPAPCRWRWLPQSSSTA